MKAPSSQSRSGPGLRVEAEPWLKFQAAKGRSRNTIELSIYGLSRFDKFMAKNGGMLRVIDIQPRHLETWHRAMIADKINIGTLINVLHHVKGYFQWLEQTGAIFSDPSRNIRLPRHERPLLPVPSEADMMKLIESIPCSSVVDLRDRAMIETAYSSGLRIGELTHLKPDYIDFENRTVRVIGKGNHERVIPLTRAAVEVIRDYRRALAASTNYRETPGSVLWISTETRQAITLVGVRQVIQRRAARAGLKLCFRCIRRAFATHLLRHGATPYELKVLLGHATFKHLRHYLRHAPEEMIAMHRRSNPGQ